MRIKLCYEQIEGKYISIPAHYNYDLQGLIYNTLSDHIATKLHDQGYQFGTRKFKLFHFSRILEYGKFVAKSNTQKYLQYGSKISFFFSSPMDGIVENLGEQAFRRREFRLFNQNLYLSSLEVETPPRLDALLHIKMLSPMTVYSTLEKPDGSKITHYYHPQDKEFNDSVLLNARKKYQLIHNQSAENLTFSIVPLYVSYKQNHSVVFFKDVPVEAWSGIYKVCGDPELIHATYESGLGSKNSAGFGMWDLWKGEGR
jgi:CRISPR-associated endoribonuclease Cas6